MKNITKAQKHRKIKFLADEMNGDIAKWLRIMGFDCIYMIGKNLDDTLLEICLKDNRILLTSDKELCKRALSLGIDCILTLENNREEKLRKIIKTLNLKDKIGEEYRCSICNTKLVKISADKVPTNIPEYVRKKFKYVWYCSNCHKAYWEGSHWTNIINFLKKILSE